VEVLAGLIQDRRLIPTCLYPKSQKSKYTPSLSRSRSLSLFSRSERAPARARALRASAEELRSEARGPGSSRPQPSWLLGVRGGLAAAPGLTGSGRPGLAE